MACQAFFSPVEHHSNGQKDANVVDKEPKVAAAEGEPIFIVDMTMIDQRYSQQGWTIKIPSMTHEKKHSSCVDRLRAKL
jgi:hypothetical protein